MPYNTQQIKRDQQNSPIPQYFNPTTDVYEPLLGRNGANRVELYGPDGTPIGTTAGKLNIRASEIESILTTIQGYVDGLEAALGEVQATPTTYTVLARLKDLSDRLGEVSSTPTANTMLARLKTLEGYLDGVEAALGTQTDAEATGNGSLIAIVKRLRTLVGQGIVTLGSAIGTTGLLMAGSDGTNARAIKTTSDGTLLTQLTGSYATIDSAPVVGVKTVSYTAAELFAGASRLANRYAMIVYNESSEPVYWGPSGVTTSTGFPLLPQDSVVFQFNPSVATAIYFIAGSNAAVRVVELA